MKVIVALAVLIAVVAARPEGDPAATILRYDNTQPGPDGFEWRWVDAVWGGRIIPWRAMCLGFDWESFVYPEALFAR